VDLYVWWRRGERADRDRAAVLWSVRGREGAGTKETAVGLPEVSTVVDRNAVGRSYKRKSNGVSMACILWQGGSVLS
jgi:hypothetical protein